jgi:N-methylhydantoinase A
LSNRGKNYRLGFDTGGTFTDFALFDESTGSLHVHKVLSTPQDPALAVIKGVRDLVERVDINPGRDHLTIYGATTVVTNAAIERKGAQTALLVTEGFRDVLEFRREQRYDIYNLFMTLPDPVVPRRLVYGIRERMNAEGQEVLALDPDSLEEAIARMREEQVRSVAVCFLHSYINGAHEAQVMRRLEAALPGVDVTLSSELVPEMREFERASTTTLNAYTRPLLREHTQNLRHQLKALGFNDDFYLMLSSGGILSSELASKIPVKAIESGPAAGALASTYYSASMGRPNILSFDMGGTTAKACLIEDRQPLVTGLFEVDRRYRFKEGSGLPVTVPSIDMIEIGAGGGSIAHVDSLGLLKVGPESAGSDPGPACYGRGGQNPTVTDADLVLGLLDADNFLGGDMKLDAAAACAVVGRLAGELGLTGVQTARGIFRVVTEAMASAARTHATDRGVDYRGLPLFAFGGAGPIHACGVATLLQSSTVIIPPQSSVLSAFGTLVTPVRLDLVHSDLVKLMDLDWERAGRTLNQMIAEAKAALREAGCAPEDVTLVFGADLRYFGQQNELTVTFSADPRSQRSTQDISAEFESEYRKLYGVNPSHVPIELVSWRLTARGPKVPFHAAARLPATPGRPNRTRHVDAWDLNADVPVFARKDLAVGQSIVGPAIIEERETTTALPPGWVAEIDVVGCIVARKQVVS